MSLRIRRIKTAAFSCLLIGALAAPYLAAADTIDELKSKIQDRTQNIADLEKEIAQYEQQIADTEKTSQNLQTAIKQLDLSRKKILTDISVTQNKISIASDTIAELSLQIGDKQDAIDHGTDALRESIKEINLADSRTFIDSILSDQTLSEYWNDVQNIQNLEGAVRSQISDLQNLKADLEDKQNETAAQKKKLVALSNTLSDQKAIVDENTKQKNQLLAQTKSAEAAYQKTLAQKQALHDKFEQELNDFEAQLKLQIDPSSLPEIGSAPLAWPLARIRITQLFGNTDFARTHALVYNGAGHNGIDLAASVGTPIMAAAAGVVEGVGDTDLVCPGASFGRWVFVRHANGLSTLYAHLSLIKAYKGEQVAPGDLVGYSGQTGYATGPHLHFTVYASQGVEITSRKSAVCAGTYTMPIADLKAYLNPLLYLPPIP